MAWEVIARRITRSTEPTITISKLGRLTFNRAATKILHDTGAESVLLMWDAEAKKVGVKRIGKKDPRAYPVRFAKDQAWSGFAAKTFLKHIGCDYSETKPYQADWDKTEDMFVFSLLLDRTTQERSARPERGGIRRQVETGKLVRSSAAL